MQTKATTNPTTDAEKNRSDGKRILVLGLGNILLKDEGIGVHVAEELQKQDLLDNVEVIDGGTAGLDVLLLTGNIDKLVIIDALRAGKRAGTIYKTRLRSEEKGRLTKFFSRQKELKISLHQLGLLEALVTAEKINCLPSEIVIIGVEPGQVDCGLELTQPVKRRVPEVIGKVLEEIKDDIHTE